MIIGFFFISAILILAYHRASLSVWTVAFATVLLLWTGLRPVATLGLVTAWIGFLVIAIALNVLPLRRLLASRHIFAMFRKRMPSMSQTEQEALAAGTVGWEGELFNGMPDWRKLVAIPKPRLSAEEQAFLDGPVAELCRMIDDWDISHERYDIPPQIWDYLKSQGFFSLIIPKLYGGKQFSALAHSEILVTLYSCSPTVASTVAVPNSLGPGELLLHYGTEEQKNYYLPRLAKGVEIPCFALTSPEAGSDAGAIPDTGIVCRGEFEGNQTIGIRLNWDKRYITLAPVATVLGLAFKLYDPERLMGEKESLGITCALIPTKTPGVIIGRRHMPLYTPFQNGPTQGKDVFIPLDWIIGGVAMAGHGWRMLVECLSVGRAISLPSSAVGGMKAGARVSGAYARIRRQFNMPIGEFEGVAEALARIAGYTYMMDAARVFTVGSIDQGAKPAIASAILKYHATERARGVCLDAMDVHGGKAICIGPKNYLNRYYQAAPIAITVEGANILTRNMIIFGQGAIRCHPYILKELTAAQLNDTKQALVQFDKAFFGHLGFTFSNIVRAFFLGLSNGRLVTAPKTVTKRYYQKLTRCSAAFALTADVCMLALGGKLKRKERLSARLGDVLSMLYLSSTVLKQFEDDGRPAEDLPLVAWACQEAIYLAQQQLDQVFKNLSNRWLAAVLKFLVFPFGKCNNRPSDKADNLLAQLLMNPSPARDRLTAGIDLQPNTTNPIAQVEQTLNLIIMAEPSYKLVQQAVRDGRITVRGFEQQVNAAVGLNLLSQAEAEQLMQADAMRKAVIAVDDFAPEEL